MDSINTIGAEKTGGFIGSILLSSKSFDFKKYVESLLSQWGIKINSDEIDEDKSTIITKVNGNNIVITLFDSRVPNEEAEQCASNNFMWKDAVEVTKTHQAHILVCLLGKEGEIVERSILFAKFMASACEQDNVIGVFSNGVVYEPGFYLTVASTIKNDVFPVLILIWIGLYQSENGISAYTYGMDVFGKINMEVLNAHKEPGELLEIFSAMASYVILQNVELKDGETIGFSEEDKHKISYSKGVALPEEMTLKIEV